MQYVLQKFCKSLVRDEILYFRQQRWKNNWRLGLQATFSPVISKLYETIDKTFFFKYSKYPKRFSEVEVREEETQSLIDVRKERAPTFWMCVPDEISSCDRRYALWLDRLPQTKNQTANIQRKINRYLWLASSNALWGNKGQNSIYDDHYDLLQ